MEDSRDFSPKQEGLVEGSTHACNEQSLGGMKCEKREEPKECDMAVYKRGPYKDGKESGMY